MFVVDLTPMRPYWKPLGMTTLTILTTLSPSIAHAYTPGTIRMKAQPIIDLMVEGAEPISYGVFVWGFIKFMLGHKAEAKDLWKGSIYGVVGIKLLPWFYDILNSVGV